MDAEGKQPRDGVFITDREVAQYFETNQPSSDETIKAFYKLSEANDLIIGNILSVSRSKYLQNKRLVSIEDFYIRERYRVKSFDTASLDECKRILESSSLSKNLKIKQT